MLSLYGFRKLDPYCFTEVGIWVIIATLKICRHLGALNPFIAVVRLPKYPLTPLRITTENRRRLRVFYTEPTLH